MYMEIRLLRLDSMHTFIRRQRFMKCRQEQSCTHSAGTAGVRGPRREQEGMDSRHLGTQWPEAPHELAQRQPAVHAMRVYYRKYL